jgi:DNA-binding transcriptional MerR regulator
MPQDEKLFYTIGEVAQLVNVKPYVLRYWESEFQKLNPQKSVTGQRAYRKKDIQVALTIKRLLYDEKYTIAGAIKKLEEMEEKASLDPFTDISGKFAGTNQDEANNRPVGKEDNLPSISRAKVQELKSLIASTNVILKKYHLS